MSDEIQLPITRNRWLGYLQIGALGVVVLVVIYFAQAPNRGIESDLQLGEVPKPIVRVTRPQVTNSLLEVELTGTASLERTATIRSEVSSRVVWISQKFRNGASIPSDEPIVRIDPTDFKLHVEAAQAVVKEAEAGVWREKERGAHDARVFARDYPELDISERIQRLPSLAKREAQLLQAQVALKIAEENLARTTIALPFDSQVVSASVELGELVHRDTVLGSVYRASAVRAEVPIEPRILEQLAPVVGRPAWVRADGKRYYAEVVQVSSTVAQTSRLATLFLEFPVITQEHPPPRPGTFVAVTIVGPELQDVYVLPEVAEQEQGSVWLLDNGKLRSHVPNTHARTNAGWIVSTFDYGDGIILGPILGARENLAVEVDHEAVNVGVEHD